MKRMNFPDRKAKRKREAVLRQWRFVETALKGEWQDTKPTEQHVKKKEIFAARYGFINLNHLEIIKIEEGTIF